MHIPQWIFADYPWTTDALEVLIALKSLWQQWEHLVLFVGLVLVVRRLHKERVGLGLKVDTLSQIVKAARDLSEAALAQTGAPASLSQQNGPGDGTGDTRNWENIRLIWRDVRDRIELAIETVPRRSQGKYSRIPRYRYLDVIDALRRDRIIGPAVAVKLQNMDAEFHRLRFKPKTATAEDLLAYKDWAQLVDHALPKLPDEELPEPPPEPLTTAPSEPAAVARQLA